MQRGRGRGHCGAAEGLGARCPCVLRVPGAWAHAPCAAGTEARRVLSAIGARDDGTLPAQAPFSRRPVGKALCGLQAPDVINATAQRGDLRGEQTAGHPEAAGTPAHRQTRRARWGWGSETLLLLSIGYSGAASWPRTLRTL